jgi:hypothetical protein
MFYYLVIVSSNPICHSNYFDSQKDRKTNFLVVCVFFFNNIRKYHYVQEEFENTKGVIRIHKSTEDRQRNGQTKNDKRTNKDLQNMHIKLKIE